MAWKLFFQILKLVGRFFLQFSMQISRQIQNSTKPASNYVAFSLFCVIFQIKGVAH